MSTMPPPTKRLKQQQDLLSFFKKSNVSEQQCRDSTKETGKGEDSATGLEAGSQSEGETGVEQQGVQTRDTQLRDSEVSGQRTEPNQPHPKFIDPQALANRTLHFQGKWYKEFPWLHYDAVKNGILCFYCMAIYQDKLTPFGAKSEPAFITSGFKNWIKACEKFKAHENSHTHRHAVSVTAQESHPINAQLSSALATQQGDNRHCLEKIVSSIKYLVRQGQALRGHDDDDSNLYQLLKNLAEDDALLAKWLLRSQKEYLSPQIQNEILCSMSNSIVSEIADKIRNLPIFEFAIIMDGTQDISGKEQESICLRYIDSDMKPHEEFIGLYSVSETTGKSLAAVVKDVLLRLNLPMHGLRGQTYDGAANMSGKHAGAQALIKQEQPLAFFVHCGAHCTNLIAQKACLASVLIRDALDWVNQLGVLFSQSGKFKAIHAATAHTENPSCTAIKPLCPTRWAVRSKAIRDVLSQYGSVLASLQEMASGASNTASTANGLLGQFRKGKTVLGLILASPVIDELECLSISFQKRTQTIAGMRTAVKVVQTSLKAKRNQESFNTLFEKAMAEVQSLGVKPITVTQRRPPPKRFTEGAKTHQPECANDHYRGEFFKVLDVVDAQLTGLFNQDDLLTLQKLEETLLSGTIDAAVIGKYPELNRELLSVQLPMFRLNYSFSNSAEAAGIIGGLPGEVRRLFGQVETLVRLLLVVSVSSSEAERSFSALRRLKTWLRSTMTQNRLNHVAVCHVHKDKLDLLDKKSVCKQFVAANERRKKHFGSFA
ncbi:zinc finger MYM-type protein 1-like isoform X1 [Xiphophorus couchianus]|uniref:zinc finger MYM-type protein 1-like isoform X1 n=2 Tax=Xiphophorus couchianus TaxID=32473 RepID=UPI0010160FF8|nr:zinc finger MYM-type protein 1-like isoform X1 [Xiphophorus couchianus]